MSDNNTTQEAKGIQDVEGAKAYLSKHNLHGLFESLASDVLNERPEDPAPFLYQKLGERIGAPASKSENQPAEEAKPAEESKPEEKPAEEAKSEEKPAEESKPAEEAKPEEKPEEKPAEEAKPEEKPEEKPAEEKPSEEKPAEEAKPEEKPAEEKPVEEAKPEEEKPAEEAKPEEKPEEKPAEEAKKDTPKYKVVFVLGGPGTGKKTLTSSLAKEGWLVAPEDKVKGDVADIKSWIVDQKEGSTIVVGGFPRELKQAMDFEAEVQEVDVVVTLNASEKTQESRLLQRGMVSGSPDDTLENIKKRQKAFQATSSVIEYFTAKNKVKAVDAEESEDAVLNAVKNA